MLSQVRVSVVCNGMHCLMLVIEHDLLILITVKCLGAAMEQSV